MNQNKKYRKVRKKVITYVWETIEVPNDKKTIGKNIRSLRKEKKLSQLELSKELGVSRASISNMEKDRHNITLEMLQRLCEYFEVQSNELLGY